MLLFLLVYSENDNIAVTNNFYCLHYMQFCARKLIQSQFLEISQFFLQEIITEVIYDNQMIISVSISLFLSAMVTELQISKHCKTLNAFSGL